MADTKITTPATPPATPVAPAPLDSAAFAAGLVEQFATSAKLTPELKAQLNTMVTNALDERFKETQDMRLGKVLGSALATL